MTTRMKRSFSFDTRDILASTKMHVLPMRKDRARALFEPVTCLSTFRNIVQRHEFYWRDAHNVVEKAEEAFQRAVVLQEETTFCTWVWNVDSPPLMLGCTFAVSPDGMLKFRGISQSG